MTQNTKKITLILILFCNIGNTRDLSFVRSGMDEHTRSSIVLKFPATIPMVLVFNKDNKIIYKTGIYKSAQEQSSGKLELETLESWYTTEESIRPVFQLSDLKSFMKSAQNELETLINSNAEKKIIYMSYKYDGENIDPNVSLKEKEVSKLLTGFQNSKNDVDILHIELYIDESMQSTQ